MIAQMKGRARHSCASLRWILAMLLICELVAVLGSDDANKGRPNKKQKRDIYQPIPVKIATGQGTPSDAEGRRVFDSDEDDEEEEQELTLYERLRNHIDMAFQSPDVPKYSSLNNPNQGAVQGNQTPKPKCGYEGNDFDPTDPNQVVSTLQPLNIKLDYRLNPWIQGIKRKLKRGTRMNWEIIVRTTLEEEENDSGFFLSTKDWTENDLLKFFTSIFSFFAGLDDPPIDATGRIQRGSVYDTKPVTRFAVMCLLTEWTRANFHCPNVGYDYVYSWHNLWLPFAAENMGKVPCDCVTLSTIVDSQVYFDYTDLNGVSTLLQGYETSFKSVLSVLREYRMQRLFGWLFNQGELLPYLKIDCD